MTTYMQSLRTKTIHQAQLKLSKHRELGELSNLNVFEVADLLDKIKKANTSEVEENSIFFSVNMN